MEQAKKENDYNKYQYLTDNELLEERAKFQRELDEVRERVNNELYEISREIELRRNKAVKAAYDKYIEAYNSYQNVIKTAPLAGTLKMPIYRAFY